MGWLGLVVFGVLLGAAGGFLAGMRRGDGRRRVQELEAELEQQQRELDRYRKDVEAHFDQTATLFRSMAGSYKDLFDHLSSGYRKLSGHEDARLFKERVTTLLVEGPPETGADRRPKRHYRTHGDPPATGPAYATEGSPLDEGVDPEAAAGSAASAPASEPERVGAEAVDPSDGSADTQRPDEDSTGSAAGTEDAPRETSDAAHRPERDTGTSTQASRNGV